MSVRFRGKVAARKLWIHVSSRMRSPRLNFAFALEETISPPSLRESRMGTNQARPGLAGSERWEAQTAQVADAGRGGRFHPRENLRQLVNTRDTSLYMGPQGAQQTPTILASEN